MDFTEARTAEERLLLTLIEKVEDNTAAVNRLLLQNSDKAWMEREGNVLEGWQPPPAFDVDQEAKWIRAQLEDAYRFNGNHCGRANVDHLYIVYMQNVDHLRASGFDVELYDNKHAINQDGQIYGTRPAGEPSAPRSCQVKWTPCQDTRISDGRASGR